MPYDTYTLEQIKERKLKERGIFTGPKDSSFKSTKKIKREAALNLGSPLIIESHVKRPKTVYEHLEEAETRSKQISPETETKVKAFVPNTSIVAVMGDLHVGHPKVDHDRIMREIQAMKNAKDAFFILAGDLIDGIFWGGESGAEQSQTLNQQHAFVRAMFKELKGLTIVAVSGEHDSKWAAKTGADPYAQFSEITGSPYIRGVAEVELSVGDMKYNIVTQHTPRGSSIYNKNHPTMRQARFDLQGADIYTSAHTHRKQISQEGVRDINGSHMVTHISTGPYKTGDGYGERLGYVSQNPDEMFGVILRLHADKKQVDVNYNILEGVRQWG